MQSRNSIRPAFVLPILVALTSFASAQTFFVNSYETTYRSGPDGLEQFLLPETLHSLATNTATGETIGASDPDPDEGYIYRVQNVESGLPSYSPLSTITRTYGSLAFVDGQAYGLSFGDLYDIDYGSPSATETYLGSTGVQNTVGAAYDPGNDVFYFISGVTDMLYTLDYETMAVTTVGPLGIDCIQGGMEFWQGTLYAAIQNNTSGMLEIGIVDTVTGTYGVHETLPSFADDVRTGITVVPEPTALILMVVGTGLLQRRR